MAALKELNPGIIRFGGSELEYFDWAKVLGGWDERTVSANGGLGGINENFIGVEEFVQLCRYIGVEPLVCIRWTNKTPGDAAAEVEYFNGSRDTNWGALRAHNGHRDPYAIKYWQIGNEIGANGYDASLKPFADAIRRVDPRVKLLSSFPDSRTLRSDGGTLDYIVRMTTRSEISRVINRNLMIFGKWFYSMRIAEMFASASPSGTPLPARGPLVEECYLHSATH